MMWAGIQSAGAPAGACQNFDIFTKWESRVHGYPAV